jgi:hypothetical protein
MMIKSVIAAALVAGGVTGPCELSTGLKGGVVVGTWGGENAGLIADDTSAHVHIACTFGNVHQGIEPDEQGHFDVPGQYVLRAYPVYVGPTLPAQFQGSVSGRVMTLRVVVTDTTAQADTTVTLGPVTLMFGREPKMGPCPICRKPGERRST